ncbi:MAG: NfeD family protein, partial [Planctomycetota bacterium]
AYTLIQQQYTWVLMIGLVFFIGTDHPPTRDDSVRLGWFRTVLGIVSLFGGLLGTFIPAVVSLSDPSTQADLARAATVLVLALVTAGIGIYLIGRNLDRIPIFDKLVLSDEPNEGASELEVLQAAARPEGGIEPGMTGTAGTVLRPSGEAEIHGRLVDVVADLGYIEAGTPIRVVKVEGMRVVVSAIREGGSDGGTA